MANKPHPLAPGSRAHPFLVWLWRISKDAARVGFALGTILATIGRVCQPLAKACEDAGRGMASACESIQTIDVGGSDE